MRPSKLTPELQERIVKHVAKGAYPEIAALAEGVASSTFYRWMQQGGGENPEPEYREFREAVERARARDEVTRITRIVDDKWVLERTRRERYAESIDVHVKEAALEVVLERLREGLDQDAFTRVLEVLAEDEGEDAPGGGEGRD